MAKFEREEPRTRVCEIEEMVDLFKQNCKNYDLNKPLLLRGMDIDCNFLSIKSSDDYMHYGRKNTYGIMLDDFIRNNVDNCPIKFKSLNLTTSYGHALRYGEVYVIIPYDNVKLGCQRRVESLSSINYSTNMSHRDLDSILRLCRVDVSTLDSIVDGIFDFLDKLQTFKTELGDYCNDAILKEYFEVNYAITRDVPFTKMLQIFDFSMTKDDILSVLKSIYRFKHLELNSKFQNELGDEIYYWISGQCLAIRKDIYEDFIKNVGY